MTIRRFQAFTFQQEKPDGVNIGDGVFGQSKRVQRLPAHGRKMSFSHRRQLLARFFRTVGLADGDLLQSPVDLHIQRLTFFPGPAILGFLRFQCRGG